MFKFRGKRKLYEDLIVGYYILEGKQHSINKFPVYPESIGVSTGQFDKNKKEIFGSIEVDGIISKGGNIVKHGNFYCQSYDSSELWGAEPQNSCNIIEAYPELVSSAVIFKDGCFRLIAYINNKVRDNICRGSLYDLMNNEWDIIDDFDMQHHDLLDNILSDFEFLNISEIKKYLRHIEIIGNQLDNPELLEK